MNKKVSILSCKEYNADLILKKMNEAWIACGGKDALNLSGKRVLLKPNILLDAKIEKVATTHPEFLRAAIRFVKLQGAEKIYVGDSPGFQKPGFSAKKCGLGAVCRDENVEFYDFSKKSIKIPCINGEKVKQFTVCDILNKIDNIISLPKLKTHQLMYYTGAVKNQFGLIPGLLKSSFHMQFPSRDSFASMILDLHLAVKPSFAFMDGIVSMEGPGPGNGFPKKTNLILSSSNFVALDTVASRIIGYDPDIIPILKNAYSRGIGLESKNDADILGLTIQEAKIHDFQKIKLTGSENQLKDLLIPSFIKEIWDNIKPKPFFSKSRCIKCGACIKICPATALKIINPKEKNMISIDYNKCIRCFCCHEICPEDAIEIKSTPNKSGVVK